ncbi:type II toxin-antitoxin system VapC family toxin [Pseudoalteromonas sp. L1]|uniref:type II toxin-antitoxin system VapC family toxin n=1 Tax=unclassified Pseudoalteromonas TaxID=194690 RepID=UPI001F2C78BB|nr:type II toxin-antitoxin system VapC family toxin [Pseudoalteromonas sp. L1]
MRSIILDTCAFLWWIDDSAELGEASKALIADPNNNIYVSAATAWEISIKTNLKKLTAPSNIPLVIQNQGFIEIPILGKHGEQAGQLPMHHKDPFDRVIISQAMESGYEVMTSDTKFSLYKTITVLDSRK